MKQFISQANKDNKIGMLSNFQMYSTDTYWPQSNPNSHITQIESQQLSLSQLLESNNPSRPMAFWGSKTWLLLKCYSPKFHQGIETSTKQSCSTCRCCESNLESFGHDIDFKIIMF